MTHTNIYRNIVLLVFIILIGSFLIYLAVNIKSNNRSNRRANNCRRDSSNSSNSILLENFGDDKINKPNKVKVKVNLDTSSIVLSFKYDITGPGSGYVPDKYLVVLAKYLDDAETGERKRIGDSQFSISDESGINNGSGNKMCTRIGNIITCEHTFLNVNSRDNQGNPYLFKAGVAAIYDNNMSEFATPDNIEGGGDFFNMTKSNNNSSVVSGGSTGSPSTGSTSVSAGSYSASGSYIDMIKSQLGGYPNNLVMDKNISDANTLSDLIDKTFAQGSLNVNVGSAAF